jgi:uncharacterized protein YgbK (DUF1537 family)
VGSAGLAASLGRLLAPRSNSKKYENRAQESGNYLLVSGTTSQVTRRQIEILVQTYPYEQIILEVDLLADHRLRDSFLQKASFVSSVLSSENVIIHIGLASNDHEINDPIKRLHTADLVVEGLGQFVARVLKYSKPGFLFATGGDTADAVLTALKGIGIRIKGEVVSGMVAGRLFGGPMDGLAVITKAGAFGKEDALVVLHKTWKKYRERQHGQG